MATVFWFKVYNPVTGGMRRAPRKATADAIHSIGAEKVWGSAEEVSDALVDFHGFYTPPPPAPSPAASWLASFSGATAERRK